jgi:hypothetical protein
MNQLFILAAINYLQQETHSKYISPSSEMTVSSNGKTSYDDYKTPKYMKHTYSKSMNNPICQPRNRGTNHSKPIKMTRVVHC